MQHDSVRARIAALTDAQVAAAHEMLAGRVDTPQTLVAYVVAEGGADPDPEALRTQLLERLPLTSVPSRVVVLAHVPRGANGKEDREQLRRLCRAAPVAARAPATDPGSDLEALVGIVWSRQLDAPAIAGRPQNIRPTQWPLPTWSRPAGRRRPSLGGPLQHAPISSTHRPDPARAAATGKPGQDRESRCRRPQARR